MLMGFYGAAVFKNLKVTICNAPYISCRNLSEKVLFQASDIISSTVELIKEACWIRKFISSSCFTNKCMAECSGA
jgi:hypothetical protein